MRNPRGPMSKAVKKSGKKPRLTAPMIPMTPEDRDRARRRCLEYLRVARMYGEDEMHKIRGFIDSWYAYHRTDDLFLKETGSHRWFNRGDLEKLTDKELLDRFPDASPDAVRDRKIRVKHHETPVERLWKMIMAIRNPNPTIEEIEAILIEHYHVTVITRSEHRARHRHQG